MKRYVNIMIVLAILGAAIAGHLTFSHYHPGLGLDSVFCGDRGGGSCFTLNQSDNSELFGLPVASFGFFFYLLMIFIFLIADYAAGDYLIYCTAAALPAVALALAADIALAVVMIVMKEMCVLCAATYLINILMLTVLLLIMKEIKNVNGLSLSGIFKKTISADGTPDSRAARSLFVVFVFLLAFAVFSTANIMKLKTAEPPASKDQIQSVLSGFYSIPVENLKLPESTLAIGNPDAKVTIFAFTDFLCTACHELYKVEKYLLAKYGNRVRFVYYNYPLDSSCNPGIARSKFVNSCVAARAAIAASRMNIFADYLSSHFSRYSSYAEGYKQEFAVSNSKDLISAGEFTGVMNDARTKKILSRDVNIAARLGVEATPTLFINGRRLEGAPPKDVMSIIIDRELRDK